jgi:PhzF family phenazine biosynthesis protein
MTDREKRFARAMGRRLQLLRGERHLTQEELGRAIGLDRSRISRYEKGRVGLNGWNVARLAEVLGVTTDELLGVKPALLHPSSRSSHPPNPSARPRAKGGDILLRRSRSLPMPLPLYQVDAFADRPFTGNPAAVCLLPEPAEAAFLQDVAREMNLAETAFLVRRGPAPADGWDLRWFTPTVEVALCGHATLASAHVLWETGALPAVETARFHTLSGLLTAERRDDWIVLDFPAEPPEAVPEPPAILLGALDAEPLWVGRNRFDYLVELSSAAAVRALSPDLRTLATLPVRGVIVTARAEETPFDFVSRFFAPAAGVDEDPVTGSAHCCLGPFWRDRLGKDTLLARQISARGGTVRVQVRGGRVDLGGQAVTVLRGELAHSTRFA